MALNPLPRPAWASPSQRQITPLLRDLRPEAGPGATRAAEAPQNTGQTGCGGGEKGECRAEGWRAGGGEGPYVQNSKEP